MQTQHTQLDLQNGGYLNCDKNKAVLMPEVTSKKNNN